MPADVVPGPTDPATSRAGLHGSNDGPAGRRAAPEGGPLDAADHAWVELTGGAAEGGAVVIPFRQSCINLDAQRPETAFNHPVWWYRQKRRGGNVQDCSGRITYVGGAEGQRIREDLTAVIAKLLTWAAEHDLPEGKDAA
jgi:hypothetical protein